MRHRLDSNRHRTAAQYRRATRLIVATLVSLALIVPPSGAAADDDLAEQSDVALGAEAGVGEE